MSLTALLQPGSHIRSAAAACIQDIGPLIDRYLRHAPARYVPAAEIHHSQHEFSAQNARPQGIPQKAHGINTSLPSQNPLQFFPSMIFLQRYLVKQVSNSQSQRQNFDYVIFIII